MWKKIIGFVIFVLMTILILWVLWNLLLNVVVFSKQSNSFYPVDSVAVDEKDSFFSSDFNFWGNSSNPPLVSKKDLGEISDLAGKLKLMKRYKYDSSLRASGANDEVLLISANLKNEKPIKISGLVLQSLISGNSVILPKGVKLFVLGRINQEEDIYLKPGELAIINSGKSPFGLSIKENMCSAYLNNFKKTVPPFNDMFCPSPQKIILNTVANVKKYGDTCMDAVHSLKRCEYFSPENKYYSKVSDECKNKLGLELTYNFCVNKYKDANSFFPPNSDWYVYLDSNKRLWKERYEVIKLMDNDGKTISVLRY